MAFVPGATERLLREFCGIGATACLIGLLSGHRAPRELAVMFCMCVLGALWTESRRSAENRANQAESIAVQKLKAEISSIKEEMTRQAVATSVGEQRVKKMADEVAALIQAEALRKGFR